MTRDRSEAPRRGRRSAGRLLRGAVAPLWPDLLAGLLAGVLWQGAVLLTPLVLARAVDEGVAAEDTRRAALWVGVLLGLGAVQAAASALRHRQAVTLRARGGAALYTQVARRILGLDPVARARWPTGEVLARGDGDVARVGVWLDSLPHTLAYAVTAVGGVALLTTVDAVLAAVVLATSGTLLAGVAVVAPRLRAAAAARQRAAGHLARLADETLAGYDVLAGLGGRPAAASRVTEASGRVRAAGRRQGTVEAAALAAIDLAPQLALAGVLLVAAARFAAGDLTAGETLAAIAYIGVLLPALRVLATRVATWQRAVASAERIAALLDTPPGLAEPARPRTLPPAGPLGRALSLRGVTVRRGGRTVLDGVDLEVAPGERLVLVGAVGSGKTTLVSLLARRLDPAGGTVALDGVDVRDLSLAALRGEVSVCDAEPRLTRGRLLDVVRLAAPGATTGQLAATARAAAADQLVRELPHGWDTPVGERGYTLSGGQRQRAALARSLLATGPGGGPGGRSVLVLDDVTSALDTRTGARVLDGLRALDGVTIVATTSRPEAVAIADRVAVLASGRIAAVGPPGELTDHPALRAALGEPARVAP